MESGFVVRSTAFVDVGTYSAVDPSWSLGRMIITIVEERAVLEAYERTGAQL